jgi:hypothetical protein
MALALSCACGAAFEVEDTFAGQAIACPDCGERLRVPPLRPPQLRTSGFALASVVLALAGAFTIIGTAVAAILGIVALVSIARHRDRLSGAGYAVLGIVLGGALTVLTGFAFSRGELFDRIRDRVIAGQVDRSGPMEIVRPADGFAITRPSRAWGVPSDDFIQTQDLIPGDGLLLFNPAKNAFLQVQRHRPGRMSLDEYRRQFLDEYRQGFPRGFSDFHERDTRLLPPKDGADIVEVRFDVKHGLQNLTYWVRFVKPSDRANDVYVISVWTNHGRLEDIEPEVRRSLDSFRLLNVR